jgi:hypothetical protein
MPDISNALDQLRAHDPARGLPPLSAAEREANRQRITASEQPNSLVPHSLLRRSRRPQNLKRSLDPRLSRMMRPFYLRRWLIRGASMTAVTVAALVGVETGGGGGVSSTGLSFAVSPAAAAQLKKVAHAAAVQPMPTSGQWEYLTIKEENVGSITAANQTVLYNDTQTIQTWYGANGDARQRIATDSFSWATPQDQATYLANQAAFDSTGEAVLKGEMTPGVFEDHFFPSNGTSTPAWGTTPPTDPQTLINDIWNQYVSANGPGPQPGLAGEKPETLWDSLTQLLLSSTSAQLRATAYQALAYVPYTTVLGAQTDQLGRSGIGISFTHDSTGTIQTLIVDPTTGDLLELDKTQKTDGNGIQAGTVTQREIFLQRAIVDADIALPNGTAQPFDSAPNN